MRAGFTWKRSEQMVVEAWSARGWSVRAGSDPAYPAQRLSYMVEDSAVAVALSERALSGEVLFGECGGS